MHSVSSVQSLSRVRLFTTPWSAAHQASQSITNSRSSLSHVHQVGDAIQPSHPLLSPSPSAPNSSQPQGLFQWVNSSHEVAKVLEFQLQHQSFQWTPRTDLLQNGLVGSPCSPRDSQESFPTPQFKSINSSVLSITALKYIYKILVYDTKDISNQWGKYRLLNRWYRDNWLIIGNKIKVRASLVV